MYKFCVFAGTTEGREIVDFLSKQPVSVTACVTTEYGGSLLEATENLCVSVKRLTEEQMAEMFTAEHFDLVIDATHPYAQIATENIAAAAAETGTEYLRLQRDGSQVSDEAVFVPDIAGAVEYLNGTDGNILLTTGSKELAKYTGIRDFAKRVFARVLPLPSSLEACSTAGVSPGHIIAMQGPFTEELNIAMLRFASAEYLVTKDSGDVGGFGEKASAAAKAGAHLVVIGRPPQLGGMTLAETVDMLCSRFGCRYRPQVAVVGIGPGSADVMTRQARSTIAAAECLIGAKRMLEAVAAPSQQVYDAIAPDAIAEIIFSHREYRRFAVVMSGDVGFFSGTKKLLPLLGDCTLEILPGLSSLSYLCARLQTSYEDVKPVSLHGRNHDIVREVRENGRVFTLVGGENGIGVMCRRLTEAGLGTCRIGVGERLSYPDEKITMGTAAELAEGSFAPLSAALIENPAPDAVVTHGLPDNVFQRGGGEEGAVPMTKSEVRSVCLSKLCLTENAVCWDVGAGTGSVAIEMALQAKKGSIFAIERRDAALELLQCNKERFSAENLTVIAGSAPEACADLPAPTHVFIGGSSGNMRQILALLLEKNPNVRIVATAVTLESTAELTDCIKEFPFSETEVVSVQVARDRKAGPYHLMTANNPVFIYTMQAGRKEE